MKKQDLLFTVQYCPRSCNIAVYPTSLFNSNHVGLVNGIHFRAIIVAQDPLKINSGLNRNLYQKRASLLGSDLQ